MGRRKRGAPVHGWIAIDKPLGVGSTQVVSAVRRAFDAQKAGHGGTLDPLATGVLPVALGEATKTVPYVMDGRKTYRFTICFGNSRTTDDREGEVVETSDVRPSDDAITAALPGFVGAIEQVPPLYSAVKVDGKRAYDLARAGGMPELKVRTVYIESFVLTARPDADHAVFEVRAGKGTYVRSLARDLARRLGTVGHVSELRRLACGPFDEASAISLDRLEELRQSAALTQALLPVETALDDIPALALTEAEARRLASGQAIALARMTNRPPPSEIVDGDTVRAMLDGTLVAIVRIDGAEVRPIRVMNL